MFSLITFLGLLSNQKDQKEDAVDKLFCSQLEILCKNTDVLAIGRA